MQQDDSDSSKNKGCKQYMEGI